MKRSSVGYASGLILGILIVTDLPSTLRTGQAPTKAATLQVNYLLNSILQRTGKEPSKSLTVHAERRPNHSLDSIPLWTGQGASKSLTVHAKRPGHSSMQVKPFFSRGTILAGTPSGPNGANRLKRNQKTLPQTAPKIADREPQDHKRLSQVRNEHYASASGTNVLAGGAQSTLPPSDKAKRPGFDLPQAHALQAPSPPERRDVPIEVARAGARVTPEQLTYATFVVNAEERGEHIVAIRPDGVYAAVDDLRSSGLMLNARAGARDGYMSVADLAPQIRAIFEPDGPTLRLDAQSAAFLSRRSSVNVTGTAEGGLASHERSGFFNYSVRTDSAGTWSSAQDLTLSDARKTFFAAASMDSHAFRRGLMNLTWNNESKRRRTVIGDVLADGGDLGSSLIIGGISIARAYDLAPQQQRGTSPTLYGTVLNPSTADVYVNGQLIRTISLPPGNYDFRDLPSIGGSTDAKIVLRDSFGSTEILSTRYYGAASLLGAGETDYSFSFGKSRGAVGWNPSFAGLAALGRYRIGLNRTTTVGGHAELSNGFENLGTSFDHAGKYGISHIAFAESRGAGGSGLAGGLGYTLGTPNLWMNMAIEATTRDYSTLVGREMPDRTTLSERVSIGVRPFRGNFASSVSYNGTRSRLGSYSRQVSLQQVAPIARGLTLLVTTGVTTTSGASHPDFSIVLLQSRTNSSRTSTSVSLQSDGAALSPVVGMQRPVPSGGGSGYEAAFRPSGSTPSTGRYAFWSPVGNLDANIGVAHTGAVTGDVSVSGAVAFAGKYRHLSAPISDSFAIVKVDGGERVKVLVDNQDAGTTDRHGFLVVPNLRSYYSQRVAVVRDDGPVNLNVSSSDRNVTVASRRGTVASFNASIVMAIIGTVSVDEENRKTIPSFGQLSLETTKKSISSALDRSGRFYFEDVPPGKYKATIHYASGECRFILEIPNTTTIEQDIGDFTCANS